MEQLVVGLMMRTRHLSSHMIRRCRHMPSRGLRSRRLQCNRLNPSSHLLEGHHRSNRAMAHKISNQNKLESRQVVTRNHGNKGPSNQIRVEKGAEPMVIKEEKSQKHFLSLFTPMAVGLTVT